MAIASRWRACRVARSAFATAGTQQGQSSGSRRTNGTPSSEACETGTSAVSAASAVACCVCPQPAPHQPPQYRHRPLRHPADRHDVTAWRLQPPQCHIVAAADTTITRRSARSRCGSVPPREAQSLPRHHCGVLPVSRSFCPAISGNARFVGYSTNNVTVTAYLGTVRKTDG